jgi:hypothetical protein
MQAVCITADLAATFHIFPFSDVPHLRRLGMPRIETSANPRQPAANPSDGPPRCKTTYGAACAGACTENMQSQWT